MESNMGAHIVSLIVGIIFGSCLVLTGLAEPDRIIGALRLKDTHVIRTIIVFLLVGITGTWIIQVLGTVEMNNNPAAIVTLIIGGLLVGAGLGLTGYSPGTSLAGAASGRLDAISTILGMFFGAYLFVFIYPPIIEPLEKMYNYGRVTLPEITNVSKAVWVIPIFAAGCLALTLSLALQRNKEAQLVKAKSHVGKDTIISEDYFDESHPKRISRDVILHEKTDFFDASMSLGFWKNLLFFIMIICLLLVQLSFWFVNQGYIEKINESTPNVPFDITMNHVAAILNISNTILAAAAVLYVLTLFFCLSSSFSAGLGGLRYISRAFFSSLVFLILLFPWQLLFGATVLGAIFSPSELVQSNSIDTSKTFPAVLLYLRFVAYWALVTLLLIRSQIYSHRWTKSLLRRMEQRI
jgi:hypothetical protein